MPELVVILIVSAIATGIAFSGLAAGVILSNRRIKGSCGGLANFKDAQGHSICEACTEPAPECRKLIEDYVAQQASESETLA